MNKQLIIKVENQCFQQTKLLNKIIGTVDIKNIAKLINAVGLTANPRKSKVCNQTDQILDTLEYNPNMFRFLSKGILISTPECHKLERGRLNLTFENESFEGILDGGHTTLACGLHILKIIGISKSSIQKIKKWDQFYELWQEVFKEDSFKKIDEKLAENSDNTDENAQIPVEICYPTDNGYSSFEQNIYYISDARNNNTALSVTTKSNHKHYYDPIKDRLDSVVNNRVMWKDNDETASGKSIKSQDIVALSLIPLIALQKNNLLHKDLEKINPVNIYSSKAKCVQTYDNLIKLESSGEENEDDLNYEDMLKKLESNELLMSAFSIMHDIPSLDDYLYLNFPKFYNKTGKRFANCLKVQKYSKTEKGKNIINRKQSSTFYEQESEYKYPKGFYTPILVSLNALLEVRDNKVRWKVSDPKNFLENNLGSILTSYFQFMEDFNSDPQVMGKSSSIYSILEREIEAALK